jgi:Na+/H+ antiporter NhaD/arsenite permease-like protein
MKRETPQAPSITTLSSVGFLVGSAIVALLVIGVGHFVRFPAWVLAAEVLATVLALFVLGSIKYRLDKNALTYGAALVIVATFWGTWWSTSVLRRQLAAEGFPALWRFARTHFLSLSGLDELVHADTMLFILGLTFFVAVIGQTRLLESLSFALLRRGRGSVASTIALITAFVAFASGILDGVSMIGLLIRTLVIILILARAARESMIFAVIVSTVVTTVCGMWLAYGEPPNLIMKSNLHPHLNDAFFLRYCLPAAVGSYLIVLWNLRRNLRGLKLDSSRLDVLDVHTADLRFLQAARHGRVLTPVEFAEEHRDDFGSQAEAVLARLRSGEPLGRALAAEGVPEATRRRLMGRYVYEDLADTLDEHYLQSLEEGPDRSKETRAKVHATFRPAAAQRRRAQTIGALSFIPFVGLLVWHAADHRVPLFLSSFAGFLVALTGIVSIQPMRRLALKEAAHEYSEYLFLLPLFLSISLLQKTGFLDQVAALIRAGIETLGVSHVAFLQLAGATILSAILDNNVVADFAGRALQGLSVGTIHLFALAQIAGYAVGGCWTHIGSAQSVVAYSFIQREVDDRYTPLRWIKAMTPVVVEVFALMTVIVYGEGFLRTLAGK